MSNNLEVEVGIEPVSENDLFFPALPFISIKATLKRKIRKETMEYIKEKRALRKKKKSIAITARYGSLIDFKCGRFSHAFKKFKKNVERFNSALFIKTKNRNGKMAKQKLKLLGM